MQQFAERTDTDPGFRMFSFHFRLYMVLVKYLSIFTMARYYEGRPIFY